MADDESLGLTTGVVQSEMSRPQRRAAYRCDITYGTMKEFGFDFLRDHSFERERKQNQLYFGSGQAGGAQPPDEQQPARKEQPSRRARSSSSRRRKRKTLTSLKFVAIFVKSRN